MAETPLLKSVRFYSGSLTVLPYDNPPRPQGRPEQGYVVLAEEKAVCIDIAPGGLLPMAQCLKDEGYAAAALVFTHHHVAESSDALKDFQEEWGAEVFLHPQDAAQVEKGSTGVTFRDPSECDLLADLGVEVLAFPGHTAGSVMLYRDTGGGMLFTGDSATALNIWLAERVGGSPLVRPPAKLSESDNELRRSWQTFDRPMATWCPLQGAPMIGRPDLAPEILEALRRKEPTERLD